MDVTRRELLRLGGADLIATGPATLASALEILIVGSLGSAAAASVYGVAKAVSSPFTLISASLSNTFAPRLAATPPERRFRVFRRGQRLGISTATGVGVVSALASVIAVPLLFGAQYEAAILPGIALMTANIFRIGSGIASTALRLERSYLRVIQIGYAALLGTVLLGIPAMHIFDIMGFVVWLCLISLFEYIVLSSSASRRLHNLAR
jgi:O-antigen/teichoic acid export membrane protein